MDIVCKKAIFGLMALTLVGSAAAQSSYSLLSPNKQIEIKIQTGDRIQYDVLFKSMPLVQKATFSIDIDHNTLGLQPRVKSAKPRSFNATLEPPVKQKFAKIHENYNELRLEMEGNYAVVFRAYNEGTAYRFETSLPANDVKVYNEEVSLNFAGDYSAYYPLEESFMSHNERRFPLFKLKEIPPSSIASLPAVVDAANGVKVAVAESDIEDYPGLWLHGTSNNGLAATFPPHYPLQEVLERDRDYKVTEAADYIAVTRGTRTYPVAAVGHRRKRWRPDHQSTGLAAGQAFAGARTRHGSSPAKWPGTGGMPTTSTVWISSPASIPRPTSTTSILPPSTACSTSFSMKAGTSSAM